jgi:hypothetical protein
MSSVEVGLRQLVDGELAAYVGESRQFNAAAEAAAGGQPQPDPKKRAGAGCSW